MEVPVPANEENRLKALQKLKILDTHSEEIYYKIIDLAATVFETPIAYISLIDRDRQWYKAKIGIEADEIPRDNAFCSYNILDESTMIISDTTLDERFKSNSMVTNDPNIRFYVGAPIKTSDNYLIGSVCVMDTKPRQASVREISILENLSAQVSSLFEIKAITQELQEIRVENKQLRILVSLCSRCEKIKDEHNHWVEIKTYLDKSDNQIVEQVLCPDCSSELETDFELV